MTTSTATDRRRLDILNDMLTQIGSNIFAISGGRKIVTGEHQLTLPVAHSYKVVVTYNEGSDTYTVAREFHRAGNVHDHGKITNVHCSELGETAYQASCYIDGKFGDAR